MELQAPPALKPGTLRIIPLGGLGEIGRNMTVFELDKQIMIVDCGVLFPEETQPGVDVILPDFSYLEDKLDRIVGMRVSKWNPRSVCLFYDGEDTALPLCGLRARA